MLTKRKERKRKRLKILERARGGHRWIDVLEESEEGTESTTSSPTVPPTKVYSRCITRGHRGSPNIRRGLGNSTFNIPSHQLCDHHVHPSLLHHVAHKQMIGDNAKKNL